MDKEEARFVLRCARPGKIETERNEFGAALARAASDQDLRDWLADEHTRDNTFAAAFRAVPVPASLRHELSIGMEWTARSGNSLNRFSSAWATLRRHFGSKHGGQMAPRSQPHVSIPTEHLP